MTESASAVFPRSWPRPSISRNCVTNCQRKPQPPFGERPASATPISYRADAERRRRISVLPLSLLSSLFSPTAS